jgi:hypothetical protein
MKSKTQIIAEQESIGNVEISREKYDSLLFFGKDCIKYNRCEEYIYFAPRSVVHPEEKIGCGEEICANCRHTKEMHGGQVRSDKQCREMIPCNAGETRCPCKKFVPSCQKKKDNHSPAEQEDLESSDKSISSLDAQSSKIFEDYKVIDGDVPKW